MAKDFSLLLLHLHLLFWVPNVFFTSGVSVNFSLNAENSDLIWTATDLVSLVKELKSSSIGISGYVGNHYGDFSSNTVSFHLRFNALELKGLLRSKASAIVLLKSKLTNLPPETRISGNDISQALLLPTLQSIHFAVRSLGLDHRVKVFPMFSFSLLENLSMAPAKKVEGLIDFLQKSKSFLLVDVPIDANLSWGSFFNQFLQQCPQMVIDTFLKFDVPLVLKVRVLVTSNGIEISEHMKKDVESSEKWLTFQGLMVGISSDSDLDHRKQRSKRENHLSSSYRILLEQNSKPKNATIRDIFTPITNPATTPSAPSGFITIPSTTPVTIVPTNPTIPDITVPSTIPPPLVPVTNPATTPTTNFPFTPSFVVPGGNIPGTMPVSPISGQIWCVVKPGVSDGALQIALDYACGIGGVDCLTIQQSGGCYNPNTIQDHASYAFNSYYQKNPTPTSCDFGGTAMLVSTNPKIKTIGDSLEKFVPFSRWTSISISKRMHMTAQSCCSNYIIASSTDPTNPLQVPLVATNGPVKRLLVFLEHFQPTTSTWWHYQCINRKALCLVNAGYGWFVSHGSGTCVYPASSSNSPVLNPGAVPDVSGGSTSIFGSNNPFGTSSPISSESFKVGTTNSLILSSVSAMILALITSLFIT